MRGIRTAGFERAALKKSLHQSRDDGRYRENSDVAVFLDRRGRRAAQARLPPRSGMIAAPLRRGEIQGVPR